MPVAFSPEGDFLLVQAAVEPRANWRHFRLFAYRLVDGAGGYLADIVADPPKLAWLP